MAVALPSPPPPRVGRLKRGFAVSPTRPFAVSQQPVDQWTTGGPVDGRSKNPLSMGICVDARHPVDHARAPSLRSLPSEHLVCNSDPHRHTATRNGPVGGHHFATFSREKQQNLGYTATFRRGLTLHGLPRRQNKLQKSANRIHTFRPSGDHWT